MSNTAGWGGGLSVPDVGFHKHTLANGLDVIVRRQAELPLVAVNLWYHVGSKDEERRQRGFAHLFEHLMFEGSEHYPGDYFKPLQRVGAGVNGSTSSDRTNYFVDIPTAHLELAVAMESDRMANLLPALSDEKLRVQKDVVKNEYRQNYANRPYGQASRILAEALYPPEHPYNWLTIGVMEDVEAATREDVESFFRRFYVPANASLCMVGDLEVDDAMGLAERYFGSIDGGGRANRPWTPAPVSQAPRKLILHDRVELERIYLTWPTVPHFTEDDAALGLAADVLSRGRASRLYRRLVVEEQLAQDEAAYHSGRELAGSFGAVVTLRPGKDAARARGVIEAELADLASRGPTDEELERVRNGRIASFIYALDNIGGFGGVADRLNAYNIYLGDPGRLRMELERYLATTVEDVRSAVERYASRPPAVELTVRGRPNVATSLPPLDRTARPEPRPARAFRAPMPERRRLACGAELWVLARRDLPVVVGTAVVRAGASADGPGRNGLAELTAAMLDEGTENRSAHQLALDAERLGTSISTGAGWDGSYVQMRCLTPHVDASLELACDVLLRPSFPENEWTRLHAQTRAGLRAERDRAEALAQRALLNVLYGAEHPYRMPSEGTEASIEGLSLGDLRAFYTRHFRPDQAAWIVAGDVDAAELADRLDARLAEWVSRAGGESLVPPVKPARPSSARIVLVDRPGAPQAVARVGHVGFARGEPDHDAAMLWNQILGGMFTSRLNAKIREEKGFTYGIRSHFDARRGPGPFWIGASLQADRLAEALNDIHTEVSVLLAERPPTPVELEDARRALIEGQARQFETPGALVSRYAGLYLHDLPIDEYVRLAERLNGIETGMMLDAARRHVHPESFVYAVVADADQVQPSLERLGWGPVERVDPEMLVQGATVDGGMR